MSDFSPIYGVSSITGKQDPVQTDGSGSLKISGTISATNPSVSATGAAVPADATFIGASDGTNLQPLLVDGSGNLKISGSISATNPSVSATGAAIPADATMIGGSDGTDLRALLTNSSGNLIEANSASIATNTSTTATNTGSIATNTSNTATNTSTTATNTGHILAATTPSHAMSAASTNATSLKASAGKVGGLTLSNAASSARYFRLYDLAVAPTVGTSPIKTTIQIPANGTVIRVYPSGLNFTSGIAYACTTGIADTDTGATGANEVSMDVDYV